MEITIQGHIVSYEKGANAGIRYLAYELDAAEQRVFFDQAYNHGSAEFENHMGTQFKLVHHGAEYELTHIM